MHCVRLVELPGVQLKDQYPLKATVHTRAEKVTLNDDSLKADASEERYVVAIS